MLPELDLLTAVFCLLPQLIPMQLEEWIPPETQRDPIIKVLDSLLYYIKEVQAENNFSNDCFSIFFPHHPHTTVLV